MYSVLVATVGLAPTKVPVLKADRCAVRIKTHVAIKGGAFGNRTR